MTSECSALCIWAILCWTALAFSTTIHFYWGTQHNMFVFRYNNTFPCQRIYVVLVSFLSAPISQKMIPYDIPQIACSNMLYLLK